MKKIIFFLLMSVGFVSYAQTEATTDTGTPEATVTPTHGQTISELAKNTPSGPEKGKIISSAARKTGLAHANAHADLANKGGRPAGVGRPANPGSQRTAAPVSAPVRGKPAVMPGRGR